MAEKRLIDANALIRRICDERDAVKIEHACDVGYHNGLNMGASMTINAPTVDAVEVVRGRWIEIPSMAPEYECSKCGQSYEWWEPSEAHYCPNCGAKMDGERRTDD